MPRAIITGAVLLLASTAAMADPLFIASPFHFRDIRSVNSTGLSPGDRLAFGVNTLRPNPRTGDGATRLVATQGMRSVEVHYIDSPAAPNEYFTSIPFDPGLTGSWTLTASNPNSQNSPLSIATPTVLRADGSIAGNTLFVRDMRASGSGTAVTFHFSAPPDSQHGAVALRVFDLDRLNAIGVATQIFARGGLPATTTSFALPAVLNPEGDTLREGGRYAVSIELDERRADNSLLSRSRSFFDFTPLPPGGPPEVFLPTITPEGGYAFDITVVAGQTVFIDPLVAIGYDYATGAGDPNFASVLLPLIGDGLFDLYLFEAGLWVFDRELAAGLVHEFGPGGVDRFRILGIEASARLDPRDVTAFVTGLTFVADGRFTGTMTPITRFVPEPVPAPGGLALLAAGLAIAGLLRHGAAPRRDGSAGRRG